MMKRVNLVSPSNVIIAVTKDQVDYLISVGYKHYEAKPARVRKIKISAEVDGNGNI